MTTLYRKNFIMLDWFNLYIFKEENNITIYTLFKFLDNKFDPQKCDARFSHKPFVTNHFHDFGTKDQMRTLHSYDLWK